MSGITKAFYDVLVSDGTLTALLATYEGDPAVFTTDPAPDNADLPYLVTAGEVSQAPFDTKTTRGRDLRRDIRCYTEANGDATTVEAIAERVRELFHREPLVIDGFGVWVADCSGPIVADEDDAYGRVVTVRLLMIEEFGS